MSRSIAALLCHAQSPLRTSGAGLRATARRAVARSVANATASRERWWSKTGSNPHRHKPISSIKASVGHALCLYPYKRWWSRTGSNRRPEACKATALPTELRPLIYYAQTLKSMVGLGRLELPTSRLSSARSNQLSYRPCVYAQPEPKP